MEKGDLDGFINHFKILVHHARYDPDHPMVLRKFTDGLPLEMYKTIYGRERPLVGYQQWREAAIDQQRKWVHVRGCLDLFKTMKPKPQFPKPRCTLRSLNAFFIHAFVPFLRGHIVEYCPTDDERSVEAAA